MAPGCSNFQFYGTFSSGPPICRSGEGKSWWGTGGPFMGTMPSVPKNGTSTLTLNREIQALMG